MSLIHKVAANIDNKNIDDITFFRKDIVYQEDINILDIEWRKIIPQPPLNSSDQTEAELKLISKKTHNRSNSDIELVYKVDANPLYLFYAFTDNNNLVFPKNKFDNFYNIIEQYIYALKIYFNRARPYQLAQVYNINIDVMQTETHHTPSYPSGHTMYAALAAHILTDIYPKFESKFFQLAEQCGTARIIQGVHFPSDNKASFVATKALYQHIKDTIYAKKDKKFPVDF
jgi:acid phosphatase (class A)